MEKYRTPGAIGPGVEVFGPEVMVADDAPLQDRLSASSAVTLRGDRQRKPSLTPSDR
jgi:hypothetical protein